MIDAAVALEGSTCASTSDERSLYRRVPCWSLQRHDAGAAHVDDL